MVQLFHYAWSAASFFANFAANITKYLETLSTISFSQWVALI
jgi:hypothetical protein